MKPPAFSFHPAAAVFLLLTSASHTAAVPAAVPVQDDEPGRQAWEVLGQYYAKPAEKGGLLNQLVDSAFADLRADDATKANRAAALLQALFRQADADEQNGRAEWRRSPAWGGGADSTARSFRTTLARQFGEKASGAEAVPIAEWLLREQRLLAAPDAAVAVIGRTSGAIADQAIRTLLESGSHSRPALLMALEQSGTRHLTANAELIRKWNKDPRQSLRTAAAGALQALGESPVSEFQPQEGFNESTVKLLTGLSALLPDPPSVNLPFGRFRISQDNGDGNPDVQTITGWLRSRQDEVLQGTSWFSDSFTLSPDPVKKCTVEFVPIDPKEAVAELLKIRADSNGQDQKPSGKPLESLSAQGGFSSQFETDLFKAPEGVLAAWLFRKGDLSSTAALLFPRLDALNDDRWALEIMRDLIGQSCHEDMLTAFSYQRDYPETLRLAQHLSQPCFTGYRYQIRTMELAAQLEKRGEDFKTFTLPTPEAWKAESATLSREQQINYLASRLRLLNCFQLSQPGDIDYKDPQFQELGRYLKRENPDKPLTLLINPYNELRGLRLQPADLIALAPFLKDGNFLPTYSYWRTFHADRTLHRVNWLVEKLVNAAAHRTLVNLEDWQDLSPQAHDDKVQEVVAWANLMTGKSLSEILRVNMAIALEWKQWYYAAHEASVLKEATFLPAFLAGAVKYPDHKADIAKFCLLLETDAALEPAQLWIKETEPRLRVYGSIILARYGDIAKRADAIATLKSALSGKWEDDLQASGIEPLLAAKDETLTEIASNLLLHPGLNWESWHWDTIQITLRLLRSGHPSALAAILAGLEDKSDPMERSGPWRKQMVKRWLTRGDIIAAGIAQIRVDYEFPLYVPDAERAAARLALAEWFKTQAALIKAGQPTPEMVTDDRPIRAAQWHIDAP